MVSGNSLPGTAVDRGVEICQLNAGWHDQVTALVLHISLTAGTWVALWRSDIHRHRCAFRFAAGVVGRNIEFHMSALVGDRVLQSSGTLVCLQAGEAVEGGRSIV